MLTHFKRYFHRIQATDIWREIHMQQVSEWNPFWADMAIIESGGIDYNV
jgi:hypothetical protein